MGRISFISRFPCKENAFESLRKGEKRNKMDFIVLNNK